ncbi:MAG: zinc-ribbon domain-containing protein [Planctomycetota bacterium]|nr:MAG: zinc-ribbon domain-containing protein [Planctomycetota bacterium]
MSLKACHECGNQVSGKATACPKCGAPMKEGIGQILMPRKKGTPERINWPVRIAMAIGFGILALIFFALSR